MVRLTHNWAPKALLIQVARNCIWKLQTEPCKLMRSGTIKNYLVLIPKLVTIKTQTLTTSFVVAVKKFAYAHIFEKKKKKPQT